MTLRAMLAEKDAEIERLRAALDASQARTERWKGRADIVATDLARAESALRELRELYAFPRLREIIDNALDREKEQGK